MLENNTKRFNRIFSMVFLSLWLTLIATPGYSAAPKKVAVIPFSMNSVQDLGFLQKGLFAMLSSRLSDPGKVEVLDRETVDKVMAAAQKSDESKGALTESKARIIGANMGVDYVLFGSLTQFGDSVSLDASMVDVTGEKQTLAFFKQSNTMGDVIPMVNTFAGDVNLKVFNRSIANELYVRPEPQGPQAPGGLQQMGGYGGGFVNLQQTGQQGFETRLKFDGRINALAAGDLNKDGIVQVVIATDSDILIHTLNNSKLLLEKKLEFSSYNRIVSLDIADINQNGYPEIFITSLNIQRENLQSFVLEYNGSAYVTLTEGEPYYFRVIDGPDKARILLGQESVGHPFKGDIFMMTASGNHYIKGKKIPLPRGASVLSVAQGPVTSPSESAYVLIDENEHLKLVSESGRVDWQGSNQLGGTEHYFLLPRNDPDGTYQERAYLNSRILFYNLGQDDKLEAFIVKNEEIGGGLGRYKRFSQGHIETLLWDGIALSPVFKTQSIQGWISDFAIADIDRDGTAELLVSVVSRTKLLTGTRGQTSNIISYKLD
ncbi:MAG: FG-GAP-like repeat-containing protein [Pseudomonadota bacterium]